MNLTKYLEPKRRILDFSECKYLGEIHQIIQDELELPEWYGQNLDALWDSITGIMYLPADITIIFEPKSGQSEEMRTEIEKIVDVFKEAKEEYAAITLEVEMKIPDRKPPDIGAMSRAELNAELEKGYEDVINERVHNLEDVVSEMRRDYGI